MDIGLGMKKNKNFCWTPMDDRLKKTIVEPYDLGSSYLAEEKISPRASWAEMYDQDDEAYLDLVMDRFGLLMILL